MKIEYFNKFNTHNYYEPIDSTFNINFKGGKIKQFLGRKAFELLSRIANVEQYNQVHKRIEVERVQIDYREIEKMLFEHMDSIRCIYNKECRMIVMGYKQMKRLGNEAHVPLTLRFPYDYDSNSIYNNKLLNFAGIEVKVVPWIDGIFAIPE